VRNVAVVTVARSDYGYLRPIMRRIQDEPGLTLQLIAGGAHLSPDFGSTVDAIEEDGFTVDARVEMPLSSDTAEGVANSMGLGTIGFAKAYAQLRPDIIVALGDRYEMHAAVVASLPFNIPVAHIAGGESSEGAIDEVIRHSITKMSHLHFVSTEVYARRVTQMGEEPWRVTVSGAPSLDNLSEITFLGPIGFSEAHGLDVSAPNLLVTFHPETRGEERTETQVGELLAALDSVDHNIVFTYPGADAHSRVIIDMIEEFAKRRERVKVIANLGIQGYYSLMSQTRAMVGNSSSGIIEAASFKLPVVNIGDRQRGRIRARNVIDTGSSREEILAGIRNALSPEFRNGLDSLVNPYGDGHAGERIVARLKSVALDHRLLKKEFHEQALDGMSPSLEGSARSI
jgi:UDP-hydrolysing UDP-N-acetyl-D-glucosamine 2-epimerase